MRASYLTIGSEVTTGSGMNFDAWSRFCNIFSLVETLAPPFLEKSSAKTFLVERSDWPHDVDNNFYRN